MKRLALLCLVTAVSGYNLVIQEFQLTGPAVNQFTCDQVANLHVGGLTLKSECYDTLTAPATDPPTVSMRHIVYRDKPLTSKAKSIDCAIELADASTIKFTIKPSMKAGQVQEQSGDATYTPITPPTTTTVPPPKPTSCTTESTECTAYCTPIPADDFCKAYCALIPTPTGCPAPTVVPPPAPNAVVIKAARKTILRPKLETMLEAPSAPEAPDASVAAVSMDSSLPAAMRYRGPGPAKPPVHRIIVEDTVVSEDVDEARRVKRADPPGADVQLKYNAVYYILDEAGNPAAVWAAVIEGIILLLLVGACFYFFFWAPRARQVAAAAADPYKEDGPSYSVSYANSSYNNQRIDAFQAPTPAAPPRPANAGYMDDYITDNIGAMSRPAAATTQPASAVTNSSAFQPTHQRFDSSGLVTVNLS